MLEKQQTTKVGSAPAICIACRGRGYAMLRCMLNQVLGRSTNGSKDKQVLYKVMTVQDLTSKSSSEYRTLFLCKRRGPKGREEGINIHPLVLICSSDPHLGVTSFQKQKRANMFWFPNARQIFHKKRRRIILSISTSLDQ